MENLTQRIRDFYHVRNEEERTGRKYTENVLLDIKWPGEGIYDDGKQDERLTGASHPGCCKQ